MRTSVIFNVLGFLLVLEGIGILISGIFFIIEGNPNWIDIMYSGSIPVLIGSFMVLTTSKVQDLNVRESLIVVTIGWIAVSFMGALPFVISGSIPGITDAIFESVSGFTTTGSSILSDIESLPLGILFWRSLTHFIGGMGIIVLALAIIPITGVGGMSLLRTESQMLTREQHVPLLAAWLRIILLIYMGLIGLETLLLRIAGLSLFDSLTHSFGTIATGGFSTKNQSVASLNNIYAEIIIMVFMFLGGMNFVIYYQLIKKRFGTVIKRDDFVFYIIFTAASILLITFVNWKYFYGSFWSSLRFSSFQMVSVSTTTGFASTDFNNWPEFNKIFLVLLMLMGASAGSTSGAIKNFRIIILFKCLFRELKRMLHPSGVFVVRINDRRIEESDLFRTIVFIATYLIIFLIISLALLLVTNLDFESALSAVAATLGGVGPGLGIVGPMGNFAEVSVVGKWIFIIAMLVGRLEIFAFLVVLHPRFWNPVKIRWRNGSN